MMSREAKIGLDLLPGNRFLIGGGHLRPRVFGGTNVRHILSQLQDLVKIICIDQAAMRRPRRVR